MRRVVSRIKNQELVKERHSQIFSAAVDLFSKKGYHKTSMKDIAEASGINLSYLYKYISSKDDILYIFYDQLHTRYKPVYQLTRKSDNQHPVVQLQQLISSILDVVHNNHNEILTMYTESRHLNPDSLMAVLSKESDMIQCVEEVINRGVGQGIFSTDDPFMAANIIQYLMVVEPLRGWNFRDRYAFHDFVTALTDFVMKSLGVDEEEWRELCGMQ